MTEEQNQFDPEPSAAPKDILNIVYDQLDFNSGQLFDVISQPLRRIRQDDWLNKGEWLTAAKRAGAEKIFFVDNNPVAVFAKCPKNQAYKIDCFNRLWSLARPRILFLECDGDLSVVDLAQKPVRQDDETRKLESLETLCSVKNVAEQLQAYHRDNIESGKVFEKGRFGDIRHRADKALISDLKKVRSELTEAGLNGDKLKYAHALIGRSIFIRYLEDRDILTKDYFKKVARQKAGWTDLINNPSSREEFDFSETDALYPRVLQNKEFTYALFRSLSKDFNGDMFPDVEQEGQHVEIKHLKLIQNLLYGNVGIQKKLFFFSYRFDIIPLDLISAIYEEFYHSVSNEADKKSNSRQDGAYYTPPVLAEFVLSRVLTVKELRKQPRVLDPACGSGIFLVEAFRRMVRYAWKKKKASLDFNELTKILGNQILGIEVNREAAGITAFSLYLAMLHYLDPPSIQQHIRNGNKLPNLLVSGKKNKNNYNSIHVANAFSIDTHDLGDVDIIVGNPPWGAPGNKADTATKEREKIMLDWCKSNSYPIGDKEPSQAFLWRALDFLKDGGRCALLTSAGVLFKDNSTTQPFRKEWMNRVRLNEVFNFTHVRKFFFRRAISPFVMIHFTKEDQGRHPVEYWSAKQLIALKETQAVLFSKYDRSYLAKQDITDNKTWKVNWFGRHADAMFLKQLGYLKTLEWVADRNNSGRGYELASKSKIADSLSSLKSMYRLETRYDSVNLTSPPEFVHRFGNKGAYFGKRIIVNEGITEKSEIKGTVIAQYFDESFCFYRSCYGLKLKRDDNKNDYNIILGILWSSFSRYFFFNTTANWGLWNHKILLEELLQLPILKNTDKKRVPQVISIVNKLQNYHPRERDILHPEGVSKEKIDAQRRKWEAELDEAVFDLYGFTEEQRDLIRDCCEVTLPFFYQPYNSVGVMPAIENGDTSWIHNYAEIFARRWKPYLNEDEVMHEDAISESLCPILREVCFRHERDVKTPDWEKPIQPANTDELKRGKMGRRPDFTCFLLNSFAAGPETYEIPFQVECKRLGKTVNSWNLNKNYADYDGFRGSSDPSPVGARHVCSTGRPEARPSPVGATCL